MDRDVQHQSENRPFPEAPPHKTPGGNEGKRLVIGIVIVAVAASIFAWNYRKQQSRRVLVFFGGANASLIRTAKNVEWLEIEHVDGDSPTANNVSFSEPLVISSQLGLIHARAALISDVSFDWNAPPKGIDWEFAMRFVDDNKSCTVLFDIPSKKCFCLDTGNAVTMGQKLTDGLRTFRSELPDRSP